MGNLSSFKCATWIIVIGGHALLILLLLRAHPQGVQIATPQPESHSILFLLKLTPTVAKPPSREFKPSGSIIIHTHASPAPDIPTHAAEAPLAKLPVDWSLEAQRAARTMVDNAMRNERETCNPTDKPGSLLPKCGKPQHEFKWDPQPKRAGFAGPLPYVRVGKHCVVGLGFLGCALGKLPEPNGHLFDGMNDPNRPQSSVPDVGP